MLDEGISPPDIDGFRPLVSLKGDFCAKKSVWYENVFIVDSKTKKGDVLYDE